MHEGAHAPVRLLHTTQRLGVARQPSSGRPCAARRGARPEIRVRASGSSSSGVGSVTGMDHTPLVWEAMPSATITSASPMPWRGQGARPR